MKRRSVLPEIAITRTDEGVMLIADRVGWKQVAWIFLLALLVISEIYLATREDLDLARRIQAAVLGVMAIGMFIGIERDYRRRRRLRGATVTLNRWPLRLGEEVKAVFRTAPASPVTASLTCCEKAKFGKETKWNVLYSFSFTGEEWTFVVPDNLPPSLVLEYNEVIWRIEATISVRGTEVPVQFNVLVMPEVAA